MIIYKLYVIDVTIINQIVLNMKKIKCPQCGALMKLKNGQYGKFTVVTFPNVDIQRK